MLYNKTKQRMIIQKISLADSLFKKFKGLMFERKENFDYALVFDFGCEVKTRASVHMLFVFFPIDLIFLDNQKRVVDIKEKFRPFELNYTPKKPARYLIELPQGSAFKIQVGDELEW